MARRWGKSNPSSLRMYSYRSFWTIVWVLATKPGSSGRTRCSLLQMRQHSSLLLLSIGWAWLCGDSFASAGGTVGVFTVPGLFGFLWCHRKVPADIYFLVLLEAEKWGRQDCFLKGLFACPVSTIVFVSSNSVFETIYFLISSEESQSQGIEFIWVTMLPLWRPDL